MKSSSTSLLKEKDERSVKNVGRKSLTPTKNGMVFMSKKNAENRLTDGELKPKNIGIPSSGVLGANNLDVLEKMWKENLQFQKALVKDFLLLTGRDQIELTKDYLLHIVSEIDELLESTGKWKRALQDEQPPSISGINQELIDIFKFIINIALLWNISPRDFVEEFSRKSEVNWAKLKMESLPEGIGKSFPGTFVFDLDGVLGKYPENWISYLKEVSSPFVPIPVHLENFQELNDLNLLSKGFDRKEYDLFKYNFREDGFEGDPEVMEGASEVTQALRKEGYKIIILTRRPAKAHKRLFADTIYWLKKNKILFDGIFWSEGEKENELRRLLEKFSISFVVEDDPNQAARLIKVGFPVLLLDRPYNRLLEDSRLTRIKSLKEILEVI